MRLPSPRFVFFMILLGGLGFVLWRPMGGAAGISLAFDLAAATYIAMALHLMARARPEEIRRHAARNDVGRSAQLAIAGALALVILVTVGVELRPEARKSAWDIAFPIATLIIAWVFGNLVYTLHYAHLFYGREDDGEDRRGLTFPQTDHPNYWDFAYFSFNIGLTYQTSDVAINSTAIRIAVIVHGAINFFFNIGILALALNIVAGAISAG